MYNVLVVDDTEIVRSRLSGMLASRDREVKEASDGEEALEVIADWGMVDLMVTDINMPGKDGYWLIERVSEGKHGKPIIIVHTTVRLYEPGRVAYDGRLVFVPKSIPKGYYRVAATVDDLLRN